MIPLQFCTASGRNRTRVKSRLSRRGRPELDPVAYSALYLWHHEQAPHTLVVGAARPSDLDETTRACQVGGACAPAAAPYNHSPPRWLSACAHCRWLLLHSTRDGRREYGIPSPPLSGWWHCGERTAKPESPIPYYQSLLFSVAFTWQGTQGWTRCVHFIDSG